MIIIGGAMRLRWHSRITAPVLRFAVLAFFPWLAVAQPQTTPRPKIGIGFEGGAALGFGHIGVLQWFEEHRIPVDFVAGLAWAEKP